MRIAWIGGIDQGGGVSGMSELLLEGLLRQEIQVDCYYSFGNIPERLREIQNLTVIYIDPQWAWGRWYSRIPVGALLSSSFARMHAYNCLCDLLIENHARQPYNCIFQFSQTELFKLGRNLNRLPPIVIFPCVHAAGELRWHRRESGYALKSENFAIHYLVRAFLTYRAWVQKRQSHKPGLIIGMSQRFNDLVATDYDILPERQAVIYNPIPGQDSTAAEIADEAAYQRKIIKLLFISRISVRKGLEYIVELSKRLDDLAGEVQIDLIGGWTLWSNYCTHLKELNSNIARYLGGMSHADIMAIYDTADILLAPSLYEPGGIVVGEALSRGVCVVASDAVGSAEIVKGGCHRPFPAGDMDEFERQVRQLIEDLKAHRQELRQGAREQAQKHFSPDKIVHDLVLLLRQVELDQDKGDVKKQILTVY
jgi:glycosyltransferase involved in cell wall biosynthesis